MGIALGVDVAGIRIIDADRLDTCLREGEELSCIGTAISVNVFPYTQLTKYRIIHINDTIGVGVEFLQRFETVCGFTAVFQQSFRAK